MSSSAGSALIVCAAPGAAAAVVATALVDAGLYLGEPSGASQEDAEISAFHAGLLEGGTTTNDAEARARDLVERKFRGRSSFGWKESRTAFLLDLWNDVLPDARWIFVYRDPALSAWSLLRARVFDQRSLLPVRRVRFALEIWREANRRIVEFASRNRERSIVLRSAEDYSSAGEAALRAALTRWALPLAPPELALVLRPYLVRRRSPRWIGLLARGSPGVGAIRRELEALRSIPPSASTAVPGATRRALCVFAAGLDQSTSQTFVHEHLERLPARTVLLQEVNGVLLTQDDRPLMNPLERAAAALLREFRFGARRLRDRALARFLRREGVEAMLIEFAVRAESLVSGCRAAGVPMVVHFHGFDAYSRRSLQENADDYPEVFAAAGAIIAVSRDMEGQLVRLGAEPAKIHYCPCGVDAELFRGADPALAPPSFVAVGRFVDKKGPHLTLLAFREVLAACPESRLIMIGAGALLESSRRLALQLGLGDAVDLRGACSPAAVRSALRAARGFVQHSIVSGGDSEGTPVAVLEASACGLPVVATRHGGIPDVVRHGESGFLVEEGDVAAMAAHMITLARDPALAARLGRRGRERILAEFASEHAIARLWRAIEAAIAAHPAR